MPIRERIVSGVDDDECAAITHIGFELRPHGIGPKFTIVVAEDGVRRPQSQVASYPRLSAAEPFGGEVDTATENRPLDSRASRSTGVVDFHL